MIRQAIRTLASSLKQVDTGQRRHTLPLFAFLPAVVVIFAACEKVPAPISDDTPPELTWMIADHRSGERQEIAAGSQPVEVRLDSGAVVTLIAKDDEGVRKIRLDGPAMAYTCARDDIGRTLGPGLLPSGDEIELAPDDEGMVMTEIFTIENVYFNVDCGDGWSLAGARAELFGFGENYFGGTVSSKLVLHYAP